MGNLPDRLTAARGEGKGTRQRRTPTLELLPWSRRPTYPTPPRGGKVEKDNQPKTKHTRKPLRSPPGLFAAGEASIGEIEAKYGLPSADRNNKATLLLTGPFRTAKSSAKDLTPLVLKLQYAKYRGPLRGPRRNRLLRH
jgi:hypothetical protein